MPDRASHLSPCIVPPQRGGHAMHVMARSGATYAKKSISEPGVVDLHVTPWIP